MATYCIYVQLFAYFALPLITLGDLAFRCPSCTAERVAACPKVTPSCEIVRELGCGCCPVCAKREGELCGVYTPRCSSGLRCYPRAEAELPLQELLDGFGHCGQKVDVDITSLDDLSTNEVHGTENPLAKRPSDARMWQESAMKQHQNKLKTKMKANQFEDSRPQTVPQTPCQQELNEVLEEISRMTSEDNRGPLENLYRLKFPNCDKHGLYSLKQEMAAIFRTYCRDKITVPSHITNMDEIPLTFNIALTHKVEKKGPARWRYAQRGTRSRRSPWFSAATETDRALDDRRRTLLHKDYEAAAGKLCHHMRVDCRRMGYDTVFMYCKSFHKINAELEPCNMSTEGQRGECWCVNPYTGIQIPETPKVRGDPDCHQFHEEPLAMPTPAMFYSPVDPSGTL
ncbi:Insulin-like growth factor-binding protein 2-B [Takifugu flavidus]|uniref:Insulin-like growth factor-binding protein 2-B n=1 Tax=Takifugu flavidus TaxID=433684 RepID=A0A5C6PNZ7_9TELE|nr:Insulin-like growth factor-binding protein 2-B [Takifugu flavidus]